MYGCLITSAILIAGFAKLAAQQPSLPEQAKEHDVRLVIHNEYSPATLPTIVSEADTVVVAVIGPGKTALSQDETQIFTDYEVAVQEVVKRTLPPGLVKGDVITVRRWGGAMSIAGHNVVAEENDFPPFEVSGTYVLFLQAVPNESYYYMAYGPQGAFYISADMVKQVSTKFGTWNNERGPMSTTAFLSEVRHLLVPRQ